VHRKKVEENNFGTRKRLLEYDDVMNKQRNVIYKRRKNALYGERLNIDIADMIYDTAEVITASNKPADNFKNFEFELIRYFSTSSPISAEEFKTKSVQEISGIVYKAVLEHYQNKTTRSAELAFPVIKNVYETPGNTFERILVPFTDGVKTLNVATNLEEAYNTQGKSLVTDFEKNITLAIIDDAWKTHLRKMDELKQSVQLAVHEQKDPLLIYKEESFSLFRNMVAEMNKDIISFLFKGELPTQEQSNIEEAKQIAQKENYTTTKEEVLNSDERAAQNRAAGANASQNQERQITETIVRNAPKIGRNDTVTVKNVMTGKTESMKFKKAEPLLKRGEYVLVNN
jgi:preprotein translocase subunit SecA